MEEPKILVTIPSMGSLRPELISRLLSEYSRDRRVDIKIISGVTDHAAARNELIMYFDPGVYSHILMIDSDMEPPSGFIDKMLIANRPVVSGVSHVWRAKNGQREPEPLWALWKRRIQPDLTETYDHVDLRDLEAENATGANVDVNSAYPGGLRTVEMEGLATGCFCMLIQDWVLVKMREQCGLPWFRTLFLHETQEKTCSEDIFFCSNLYKMGIKITVLPDLICRHFKITALSDVMEYGNRMYELGLRKAMNQVIVGETI